MVYYNSLKGISAAYSPSVSRGLCRFYLEYGKWFLCVVFLESHVKLFPVGEWVEKSKKGISGKFLSLPGFLLAVYRSAGRMFLEKWDI
jgi:hypothetical protein